MQIGSDRSENLAGICQSRGFQVFVGDVLSIPIRSGTVDVGLCIAVIHHLSTQVRNIHTYLTPLFHQFFFKVNKSVLWDKSILGLLNKTLKLEAGQMLKCLSRKAHEIMNYFISCETENRKECIVLQNL